MEGLSGSFVLVMESGVNVFGEFVAADICAEIELMIGIQESRVWGGSGRGKSVCGGKLFAVRLLC